MKCVLLLMYFFAAGVEGVLFTDEDNARLPRLFHLDDYERCLLQKNGLYCLGVFDLSPIEPSPTYDYIKEYSSSPFAFNRSRLHRGYCVSTRCPSTERNASLRFERCVDERARRYALSARIRTLNYCTTREQYLAKAQQPPDDAQLLFLRVVWAVLVFNVVGTVYDVVTGDHKNKIGLLTAWSVRASWRRLVATYDHGDPRLKQLEPIQGMRMVVMMLTMYAHARTYDFQYYVTNPNYVENLSYGSGGVLFANGTSLIMMYVIVSTFLTAYNLLLYSEKHQLSFKMLPVLLVKRMIRISPVHLLLVGYNATWWPPPRAAALAATFLEERAICRNKFWAHAFFLNNIIDRRYICLMPTWFLPVDMHLYIAACALTIALHRWRHALRLYGSLFIISGVGCGVVSYLTGWQAMIYFSVPEKLRGFFSSEESFGEYYTSSWGALPALCVGLFMAHLHYLLQGRNYHYHGNKWLRPLADSCVVIALVWILFVGSFIRQYSHPVIKAVYVGLDRPFICSILFLMIFAGLNIDSFQRRLYGWRGWRVAARLSLPVMMSHWLVNAYVSARPAAYHTSVLDLTIDYIAVMFFSHVVSVPIALLVEIPVQRFFAQFI